MGRSHGAGGAGGGEHPSEGTPDGTACLATLLGQVVREDDAAFAQLYELTNRRVFGLALRILREPEAAEEAALEAYSTVWRNAAQFDERKGSPMTWILTVTRSKAIDLFRARKRRVDREGHGFSPTFDPQDPGPSPEAISAHSERCAQVEVALATLPHEQRRAIETVYFAGLSHSEVAAELGEPLGTIKSRIRLGLTTLRRHMTGGG